MTFASTMLSKSPLWWPRLGEASGTTMADASGNARDGTYSGGPTLGATGLLFADPTATSVNWAASSDQGVVPSASWMNLTTGFTFVVWFKTSSNGRMSFFSRNNGGGNAADRHFFFGIDGGSGWFTRINSPNDWVGPSGLADNAAHMLAMSMDATNVKWYKDGYLVGTQSGGSLIAPTNAVDLIVGADHGNFGSYDHGYTGLQQDPAIFGTVLTGTDILDIWHAGMPTQSRLDAEFAEVLVQPDAPNRALDGEMAEVLVQPDNASRSLDGIEAEVLIQPNNAQRVLDGTMLEVLVSTRTHSDYATEVMADSPVVWYRQNESSGTQLTDSSGNARHGLYVNSPTLQQPSLLVSEPANKSVSYNGTTQYSETAYSSWMNLGEMTCEAWFVVPSGNGAIVDRDGFTLGRHFQFRKWSGKLELVAFVSGGSTVVLTGNTTLTAGSTVYGAFSWKNGVGGKLYLNGVLDATPVAAVNTLALAQTNALNIGVNHAGSYNNYFTGQIDEVALYGTQLSDERIRAHYEAGTNYSNPAIPRGVTSVSGTDVQVKHPDGVWRTLRVHPL